MLAQRRPRLFAAVHRAFPLCTCPAAFHCPERYEFSRIFVSRLSAICYECRLREAQEISKLPWIDLTFASRCRAPISCSPG
jgi:hypothetical protein